MSVLFDTYVWGGVKGELAASGHDVVWAGDWPEDPGDDEIIARAFREGRMLVTLDKDFGELAFEYEKPHAVIVRIVDFSARSQATVCKEVLTRFCPELMGSSIVTVQPGRVRIRSVEKSDGS